MVNNSEKAISSEQYPAKRTVKDFPIGEQVLVPVSLYATGGMTEVREGVVAPIEVKGISLAHQPSDPDKHGHIKVLTRRPDNKSSMFWVGNVNYAGLVPKELAPQLIASSDLQDEWREGAQFSADDNWDEYIELLAGALENLKSDSSSQASSSSHPYHRPVVGHVGKSHMEKRAHNINRARLVA